MAWAVAVTQLRNVATAIMAAEGNVGVMRNLVLLVFLLLIMAVVHGLARVEQWLVRRTRT